MKKYKLDELKELIEDSNGVIKVQNSITGEYFVIDNVALDIHGDLLIKILWF